MSWLHAYWAYVGGNIEAMPLEFVITVLVTYIFRHRIIAAAKKIRYETDMLRRAAEERQERVEQEFREHLTELRKHVEHIKSKLED